MAKKYLEHALEIDPKNYMAHYLLGQAYRALGRTDDASREYQAAAKIQEVSEPHLESSQ
jgi:Tfp pilus assembly protein PilF